MPHLKSALHEYASSISGATSVFCLTGETSVPGVLWLPHQGAGPFLLDVQF